MTEPDGRPLAAMLAGSLARAAVAVDGADRVLAWNAAAEAELGLAPGSAGRTLAQLGLLDIPGAVRLGLLDAGATHPGATTDGAVAIVAWADSVPDTEIALQKVRALARLAPGVKHQGNNHLAGFASFFGLLRGNEAFVADFGATIIAALELNAKRAPELLGSFAELARDRPPAPAPQPLATKVDQALLLTTYAMDVKRSVTVPVDLPEVLADGSRLHQALVAILVNALDAMGGARARGNLAITATFVEEGGSPVVRLVFEDDAPTVPAVDRPHLFERVPPPGTGPRAGLDLAVARRLLELDGGTLEYEAARDGHNRFVATLVVPDDQLREGAETGGALAMGRSPAARTWGLRGTVSPAPVAAPAPAPAPAAAPAPAPAPAAAARPLTVLVCDDEEQLRTLMTRMLERHRHRVLLASSAAEALATLDREHVDVVMSDHNMATMTGVELYAAACERHPHLRRRFVLMSGDPGEPAIQAFASQTGLPVLTKPFPFAELEAIIREVARG